MTATPRRVPTRKGPEEKREERPCSALQNQKSESWSQYITECIVVVALSYVSCRFVKAFRKFAQPMSRLDAIACEAELADEHSSSELQLLGDALIKGCKTAVEVYDPPPTDAEGLSFPTLILSCSLFIVPQVSGKKKDRGPVCKLGPVEFLVRPLIRIQADLEPLDQIMPENSNERKQYDGLVKSVLNK